MRFTKLFLEAIFRKSRSLRTRLVQTFSNCYLVILRLGNAYLLIKDPFRSNLWERFEFNSTGITLFFMMIRLTLFMPLRVISNAPMIWASKLFLFSLMWLCNFAVIARYWFSSDRFTVLTIKRRSSVKKKKEPEAPPLLVDLPYELSWLVLKICPLLFRGARDSIMSCSLMPRCYLISYIKVGEKLLIVHSVEIS